MKRLFVVMGIMAVMLTGCTEAPIKNDLALVQSKNSCQNKFETWKKENSKIHIVKEAYFNSAMDACLVEITMPSEIPTEYLRNRVINIYSGNEPLVELIYYNGHPLNIDSHIDFYENGKLIDNKYGSDKKYFKEVNKMFEINQ